jgi:hypothetical protein
VQMQMVLSASNFASVITVAGISLVVRLLESSRSAWKLVGSSATPNEQIVRATHTESIGG